MRWMIKDKQLKDYLQACKNADLSNIENNGILMNMFNTSQNYRAHMDRIGGYFGPLDGMRICEIGGGYGGQCKMICERYKPGCYHIIDLPEVCELQRRYCDAECYTEPTGQEYDLVISNYALSEIIDNKPYIDGVLRKSKHGYIACNTDFVQLDWPHFKYMDIEGERKENYILVW